MARDDGGAAGTVIVAFVLGALTGAAVALLMAPATGEETRRVLADKAREGRQRANEAARQGREFVNRQRILFGVGFRRAGDAHGTVSGAHFLDEVAHTVERIFIIIDSGGAAGQADLAHQRRAVGDETASFGQRAL